MIDEKGILALERKIAETVVYIENLKKENKRLILVHEKQSENLHHLLKEREQNKDQNDPPLNQNLEEKKKKIHKKIDEILIKLNLVKAS